jgi:hypothetical protein
MQRIVKAHLNTFVKEQSLENLDESKQFEIFSNFCILHKFYTGRFDPNAVTSEEDDCGIDGIGFIIDGELVTTVDEATTIFKRNKKNMLVHIVFMQAKTSEKFELGEILKFGNGVSTFLSDSPNLPQGEFIQHSKELFNLIIDNVPKIASGKPNCHLFYITTGKYNQEREIEGSFKNIQDNINRLSLFNSISLTPIDEPELIKLWASTSERVKARLETQGYIFYPEISGINEAYIAIVPATNFVHNVLCDQDGKLRNFLFQENVRAFLGKENSVNKMIQDTLRNEIGRKRFSILNNGITIISPDVRVQNNTIFIENFQIVNGCQTSNVLYENKDSLSAETMLTIKVVEADDYDVISDIVRATNSQTKVENIQFLSRKPIIRKVEQYFEAVAKENNDEIKLYFERRERQFVGHEIPDNRIFDIKEASRAVASMFLERPDLATRYPTQMIEDLLHEQLFNDQNREVAFYAASLAIYRIKLLIGNKKIPYNFGKYKWHMLMCLKYVITGKSGPKLTSKKMESFCEQIINVCKYLNDENLNYFKKVENIIKQSEKASSDGVVSTDRLKRQAYTDELKKIIHS